MPKLKWWSPLRLAVRYVRAHESLASSLLRIANHVDPPGLTAELPDDPPRVSLPNAALDFRAIDDVRSRLTRQLGHDPEPDQILHELDGIEWTQADADELQHQRQRRR